jgi:hypothetical protein
VRGGCEKRESEGENDGFHGENRRRRLKRTLVSIWAEKLYKMWFSHFFSR